MMNRYCEVTDEKINISPLMQRAEHEASGGVVVFCGNVRNTNHGKRVSHLEYESHKVLAKVVLEEIVEKSIEKWNLNYAIAVHRTGRLEVGETAVVVITSTGHRKEAYEANQYIINHLKAEAPIWKKEVFVDGSHKWGNHCNC